MKECLKRLMQNINKLEKLPIKRYSWDIEMAILSLDIEICDFMRKYENASKKKLSSRPSRTLK